MQETKTCINCNETKPLNHKNFPLAASNKDGYRKHCRPCWNEYNRFRIQLKEATKRPTMYMECQQCEHLFFKLIHSWSSGIKRKECPKCGCKHITPVETSA